MTPQAGSIAALTVILFTGIAMPAGAQSEAFVHVGVFGAGSDEGSIGSALSIGSTLTVPLIGRLAADLDLQTSRLSRTRGRPEDVYDTRRTLLIPSLLYRVGSGSVYGYIGGGIGAEFDRSTYVRAGVPYDEQSDIDWKISFRGGITGFPVGRFGIRADVYMAGWHLGARLGVGYRFQGSRQRSPACWEGLLRRG